MYESPAPKTQKLKQELSNSSVEAEETDQQRGQVVQYFSCTACAKFSTETQQEMWDHMFSAHVQVQNVIIPPQRTFF